MVMKSPFELVTKSDYPIVMKDVRIAELKAKLSEYLRRVRRGESVTVMDRDTPIAVIRPYPREAGQLTVRSPSARAPKPSQVELPPPLPIQTDIVEVLLAERQDEP